MFFLTSCDFKYKFPIHRRHWKVNKWWTFADWYFRSLLLYVWNMTVFVIQPENSSGHFELFIRTAFLQHQLANGPFSAVALHVWRSTRLCNIVPCSQKLSWRVNRIVIKIKNIAHTESIKSHTWDIFERFLKCNQTIKHCFSHSSSSLCILCTLKKLWHFWF